MGDCAELHIRDITHDFRSFFTSQEFTSKELFSHILDFYELRGDWNRGAKLCYILIRVYRPMKTSVFHFSSK